MKRKRAIVRVSDRLILELLGISDKHILSGASFSQKTMTLNLFLEGGNCPLANEEGMSITLPVSERRAVIATVDGLQDREESPQVEASPDISRGLHSDMYDPTKDHLLSEQERAVMSEYRASAASFGSKVKLRESTQK